MSYSKPEGGENVVITGISGKFSGSENVNKFGECLFNKVDLVCGDFGKHQKNPELPKRTGKLVGHEKFDAGSFGITTIQTDVMNPGMRIVLESVYEAILDAGYHPDDVANTSTAVIVASSWVETEYVMFQESLKTFCDVITGTQRSMQAKRISYQFKLKGPSYQLDAACSSSLIALEHALVAIRKGMCDKAIVCGMNLCLSPGISLELSRLGVLSPTGRSKPFDNDVDGYTRSEAIVALLLEKSSEAKRTYAEIAHAKINCDGYKPQGITFPSTELQKALIRDVHYESKIDPGELTYSEAHCTGTSVGDLAELSALDEIFCKDRHTPFYIGSVKSNIGHAEAASGLCSVVKILLAMERGSIPPNINCSSVRKEIKGLQEGKMIVLTEELPLLDNQTLFGVNNFGFGGSNAYSLLRRHYKTKTVIGERFNNLPILICVSSRTEEGISVVLDDFLKQKLDSEFAYLIHQAFRKPHENHLYRGYGIYNEQCEIVRSKKLTQNYSELSLVFTNCNESWLHIGRQLIILPAFRKVVEGIQPILRQITNTDIMKILTKACEISLIEQHLIASAVQIGLAEVLTEIQLIPARIIGVGTGELVAAYFNDTQTLKETLLEIHSLASNLSKLDTQSHMDKTDNSDTLQLVIGTNPSNVDTDNILLLINSNSESYIQDFLTSLGDLYQYGYPMRLDKLYLPVDLPVSRGTPMLSSLIKWNHNRHCRVELFEPQIGATLDHIWEIDPKFKRWNFISEHIIHRKLNADHFSDKNYVGEDNIFPVSGCLVLIWESLAMMLNKSMEDLKVVFENVEIIKIPTIRKDKSLKLEVVICSANQDFEIIEDATILAKGKVFEQTKEQILFDSPILVEETQLLMDRESIYEVLRLRGYKYNEEFKCIRKCNPQISQAIIEWNDNWISYIDSVLQLATLWVDTEKVHFTKNIERLILDASQHIKQISMKNILIPINFHQAMGVIRAPGLEIIGYKTMILDEDESDDSVLETAKFVSNHCRLDLENSIRSCIQLIAENVNVVKIDIVEIKEAQRQCQLLHPIFQKAIDNSPLIECNITVITTDQSDSLEIILKKRSLNLKSYCLIIIAPNILEITWILDALMPIRSENIFVISREPINNNVYEFGNHYLRVICSYTTDKEILVLLRTIVDDNSTSLPRRYIDVSNSLDNFHWLSKLQGMLKENCKIIIYAENDKLNGILGFVNCLRKEYEVNKVQSVFIMDNAPNFDPDLPFYEEQLKKNLVFNVWKSGSWGTYRHLPLLEAQLVETEHCCLNVATSSHIPTLIWTEEILNQTVYEDVFDIYYSAVNVRSFLVEKQRIDRVFEDGSKPICLRAMDFAGRNSRGERIMGICPDGCITIATRCKLLLPIPENWTMEEAATVMTAYGHVISTLLKDGSLKSGKSVLIYCGTDGVGLAAINICTHFGVTIFVAVDAAAEHQFIKQYYKIKEDHITTLRDPSLQTVIHKCTNGKGVDYVLNSLGAETYLASIPYLYVGGKFINIATRSEDHVPFNLDLLEKEIQYETSTFDNDVLNNVNLDYYTQKFMDLIQRGIIKPLPRITFTYHQLKEVYKCIADDKYIGKVLISLREEESINVKLGSLSKPVFKALPRFCCKPECSYLICGGLGGVGVKLVDLLVAKGAKKLILTSKSGLITGYHLYKIRIWEGYGVTVVTTTKDASMLDDCFELLNTANKLGPLDGIFNLALALEDAIFENQNLKMFKTVMAPKAYSTQNLDSISRKLCQNLRYFVVFSSFTCGRGYQGQTNYGMANSIMERICEERKKHGYPALAIQFSLIKDVGVAARLHQNENTVLEGTAGQRVSRCLQQMVTFLEQNEPIVACMSIAEKKDDNEESSLYETVLGIMGIVNKNSISTQFTLPELGMDSRSRIEIKQTLERRYGIFLETQDLLGLTLAKLKEMRSPNYQ